MHMRTLIATALALLVALAVPSPAAQPTGVGAIDGRWTYVEDRTEGRAVEDHQPSTSSRLTLRVEEDAVVFVRSDGEIRMPLDGSPVDVQREFGVSRYSGQWSDGAYVFESVPVREPGDTRTGGLIRWELRPTPEGLLARASVDPPDGFTSLALYRHAEDIPLPEPAPATIGDIAWLAGAWVGTRGTGGTTSIEERWTPALGGAMLGVSRTVSRGAMRAFEFLRIVERDGGLVYVAQPNGGAATQFVLTEIDANRAVFENPRHDFPQRIIYERSPDGRLTASIAYARGGRPRPFEYSREGEEAETPASP
ncbi:MAG: hypothetical protein H6809_04485 [Phycisphaeraceae bacterium]|nr:hypothetical protein [Phycisphaeraceae bacterium]